MQTNYSSRTDSWSTINLIQPSSQVKDHTEVYVSKTDKNLGSMDNQVEGLTDRFYSINVDYGQYHTYCNTLSTFMYRVSHKRRPTAKLFEVDIFEHLTN